MRALSSDLVDRSVDDRRARLAAANDGWGQCHLRGSAVVAIFVRQSH